MDTWGVTVWRGTGMSDEQHVEFSRNFGYLERVPRREGARFRLAHRELFAASNLNLAGEITQDVAAIQYRKGDRLLQPRPEERRVGKEGVIRCRYGGSP